MADVDIQEKLVKLLETASSLCKRCHLLDVNGINKLEKKCRAELRFLQVLKTSKAIKVSQLSSTNIYHLQGIVTGAESLPGVTNVLHSFNSPFLGRSMTVDIVCNGGATWVKVIARNVKALATDIAERQEFGSKSIFEQIDEYKQLANHHRHNFAVPDVVIMFCNEALPPPDIVVLMENLNVQVKSTFESPKSLIDLQETSPTCVPALCKSSAGEMTSDISDGIGSVDALTKVNLDVTTLIALTSNVCNGGCNFVFNEAILTQQAAEERVNPSLPRLQQFLANKQLLICESAQSDFMSILNVVGGPREKERAHRLMQMLTIVKDCQSAKANQLRVTSHIKPRALTIFSTGDSHQAATATANQKFVRAASQAGVEFVVFLHPARALTEAKEQTAKAIDDKCCFSLPS